jgi:hypothetical protein
MTQNNQDQQLQNPETNIKNITPKKIILLITAVILLILITAIATATYYNNNITDRSKSGDQKKNDTSESKKPEILNTNARPFVGVDTGVVLVLDKCDLAIWNETKNMSNPDTAGIFEFKDFYAKQTEEQLKFVKSYRIGEEYPFGFNGLKVECFDKNFSLEELTTAKFSADLEAKRFTTDPATDSEGNIIVEGAKISEIDKNQMCKEIGMTDASCRVITSKVTKVVEYSIEPSETFYYHFNYNDKTYLFSHYAPVTNDLLVQFNSLAPTTPSLNYSGNGDYYYSTKSELSYGKTNEVCGLSLDYRFPDYFPNKEIKFRYNSQNKSIGLYNEINYNLGDNGKPTIELQCDPDPATIKSSNETVGFELNKDMFNDYEKVTDVKKSIDKYKESSQAAENELVSTENIFFVLNGKNYRLSRSYYKEKLPVLFNINSSLN